MRPADGRAQERNLRHKLVGDRLVLAVVSLLRALQEEPESEVRRVRAERCDRLQRKRKQLPGKPQDGKYSGES